MITQMIRLLPDTWRGRIALLVLLLIPVVALTSQGVYATTLGATNATLATKAFTNKQQNLAACAGAVASTQVVTNKNKAITGVTVTFTKANSCTNAEASVAVVDAANKVDDGWKALPVGATTVTINTKGQAKADKQYEFEVNIS